MDGRRHPRIAVRARVWCEGDELTLYARVLDVSAGGLSIRTARPFEVGREVHLRVRGPEGEAIALARVAWCRPDGDAIMGLELVSFERGREVFDALIDRALAREARLSSPDPFEAGLEA